jgi:ABC-type Fe3+-hydroxamate transport system substrate-binding protein
VFRFRSLLAPLLAAASVVACGTARDSLGRTKSQLDIDDFGDTVRLTTAPARIVTLNPATTEILFALGAGPHVIGRTHWDSWPDSARLVPDLGDGLRPNVEAVLAARPDLVVLYASADNRDARERLRSAGVRTLALKIDRIADFRRATRLLGTMIGDTARAHKVVDSVDATLDRVRAATTPLPHPTVFWHVWDAPLIGVGGGSYMNELIEIAGGRNVYGSLPAPSPQLSFEDLLRRDPDVVLAGQSGVATLKGNGNWQTLRAVRTGHLFVMDTSLTGRPSVRLGEAATALARLLHPDAAFVRALPVAPVAR